VNCNQELCIELCSVINFHCEIEPANLLQYEQYLTGIISIFLVVKTVDNRFIIDTYFSLIVNPLKPNCFS
jgi:hypothetical protein